MCYAGVGLPANFEAANGWLRIFRERFRIVQRTISGKTSSVIMSVVEDYIMPMKQFLIIALYVYSPNLGYQLDGFPLFISVSF